MQIDPTQKRKGRQGDNPGIHWRRWSLTSPFPVKTSVITMTTFLFQWHRSTEKDHISITKQNIANREHILCHILCLQRTVITVRTGDAMSSQALLPSIIQKVIYKKFDNNLPKSENHTTQNIEEVITHRVLMCLGDTRATCSQSNNTVPRGIHSALCWQSDQVTCDARGAIQYTKRRLILRFIVNTMKRMYTCTLCCVLS